MCLNLKLNRTTAVSFLPTRIISYKYFCKKVLDLNLCNGGEWTIRTRLHFLHIDRVCSFHTCLWASKTSSFPLCIHRQVVVKARRCLQIACSMIFASHSSFIVRLIGWCKFYAILALYWRRAYYYIFFLFIYLSPAVLVIMLPNGPESTMHWSVRFFFF